MTDAPLYSSAWHINVQEDTADEYKSYRIRDGVCHCFLWFLCIRCDGGTLCGERIREPGPRLGDAVMVSPDGLAQVHLDDGNVITVSPGQVLNVPAKARAKDAALPNGAQATADLPIAAPATVPAATAPACAEPCINPLPAFLLLGAGIGGAIALSNEHGGATSASP